MTQYKVYNGTSYHEETSIKIVNILETARFTPRHRSGARIVVDYGDVVTGQSWGEVYDVTGYVERSTGMYKVPLLIHNNRSIGGSAISDHCIVKISLSKGKRVLYQHPTYKPATV